MTIGVHSIVRPGAMSAPGGATGEAGLWKSARLADIARENHLPSILLVESAGVDLRELMVVADEDDFRSASRGGGRGLPRLPRFPGGARRGSGGRGRCGRC